MANEPEGDERIFAYTARSHARYRGRVSTEWNWWAINRPHLGLCEAADVRSIWLGVTWGNGNGDPVWRFDVRLSGLLARPFIAWSNRRWDQSVLAEERRRGERQ